MSFWTAIVLIVAIVAISAAIKSRHNAMNGYGTDSDGNPVGPSVREREMAEEMEQLRERVKVLERIATDDREAKRLSSEIDALRDKQED